MSTIRLAEIRDAERIHEILYQVHDVHAQGRPDIFVVGGVKYTTEEVRELIADPGIFTAVGEDAEGIVQGYIICYYEEVSGEASRHDRKTLYVDDLCVEADYRGHHLGRALYAFAVEEARKQGCASVTLNVWECNEGARGFYEHLGLKPLKTMMEEIL